MSDGKLQYEIEVTGTAAASAGLGKVETGLDKVSAAEKRTRESAYGARQAHENWVSGYKGEVFSEMAEKIKRVAHVSRETNPSLKWMNEGFSVAKTGAGNLGSTLSSVRQVTMGANQAWIAAGQFLRGDFVSGAASASRAWYNFRNVMLVNPFIRLGGFAVAAAIVVSKAFGDMAQKTDEFKKKLEDLRDFRASQSAWIEKEKGDDYNSKASKAIQAENDPARLREMLAGAKAEMAAREQTVNKNAAEYHDKKREAAKEAAKDSALVNWALPKKAEGAEKGKRLDESAERFREQILDQSKTNLSDSIARVRAIEEKLQQAGGARGNGGSGAATGSGHSRSLDEETDDARFELAKDRFRARIKDPLQLMQADLAAVRERKGNVDMSTESGRAEEVRLAREEFELEKMISDERNSRATKEQDARKALEIRREEYAFSKMTSQEQLAAVNAKIAALRGSTSAPTTDQKNKMLDLVQKRDRLKEEVDREAAGGKSDRSSGDEGGDDDDGRRVVSGADYSMKEFNPGRRRFRGMGRQGFMGKGQGRAAAWFANQTESRFAAAGHVGVPSEMGRPQLDVKGIDQTNRLLAEIRERL